jgi:DNA-directed RNA polymerase omega subunit
MYIPEEIGSKYRLIVLAGRRVAQLQRGAKPRIEDSEGLKPTQIAVEEIIQGKINFSDNSQADD